MKDDTISRAAALTALGEEPPVWYDGEDEIAERNQWRRDVAAIKALPSAVPVNIAKLQPNCNQVASDCISRQAMLNEIDLHVGILYDSPTLVESLKTLVRALPSAQPSATDTNVGGNLIDKRAALDALDKRFDAVPMELTTEILQLRRDLRNLPSAQPGWIPVTEKPIEDGQYIVTLKDDKEVWTDIAEWNATFGGRWQAEFFDCEYCDIDNVVAWQPLPKPWEGGQ